MTGHGKVVQFPGPRRPLAPVTPPGGAAGSAAPAAPVTMAISCGPGAPAGRRSLGWVDPRGRSIVLDGDTLALRVAAVTIRLAA